jgi:hypothetical protein
MLERRTRGNSQRADAALSKELRELIDEWQSCSRRSEAG